MMPSLFMCQNAGLESASTTVTGGLSYATGAKVALQLQIPSGGQIQITGWGVSFDEDATTNASANAATVSLQSTATASTVSTAHTTSTVFNLDPNAAASRLTYGATTNTGFGNGGITSRAALRVADRRYVQQTGSIDVLYPSDRWMVFGATGAAQYVHLIMNTTATVNALCWMQWIEMI